MENEDRLYRMWWDDEAGVARVEWREGAVCTIDEARGIDTAIEALGHGKVPALVNLRQLVSIDRDAREFFNDSDTYTAMAFIVSSAATRMMANFFLGLHRGKDPLKMFTVEAEALVWLQFQR